MPKYYDIDHPGAAGDPDYCEECEQLEENCECAGEPDYEMMARDREDDRYDRYNY